MSQRSEKPVNPARRRFLKTTATLPLVAMSIEAVSGRVARAQALAATPSSVYFSHPDRIRYDRQCFTIEGQDTVIYSGCFHYFRCPKPLWRDRFKKIKAAGFNAVETYVPWNWHEPQMPASQGDFSKVDLTDLDDYLTMAEQFGLWVIARPGPYICSEWDEGGFPGWLVTKRPEGGHEPWYRTDEPTFVSWSAHWFDAVCPTIAKHQITRRKPGTGGVILFQLENEYNYTGLPYSVMSNYIKALAHMATGHGIEVPLFTCWTEPVRNDKDKVLSQIYDSCNFYPGWGVDNTRPRVEKLRREQPHAPLQTTELQGGWFTSVTDKQILNPDEDRYRSDLGPDQINNLTLFMLELGETALNYYMLFGGTNFADHAGKNISTSYDYSAPIRECGGVGSKYAAVESLGRMLGEHGQRLARAEKVETNADTGHKDVHVAIRKAQDGSRYVFVRTNQHHSARQGTAKVTEKHAGGRTWTIHYDLPSFGSKLLYLPADAKAASDGKWLVRGGSQPARPSESPAVVTITEAKMKPDGGPRRWRTQEAGQSLNDCGIYDCRHVFYRHQVDVKPDSAQAKGDQILIASVPADDAVVAQLRGKRLLPGSKTPSKVDLGERLQVGTNDLLMVYENSGRANGGVAMEKQSGIESLKILPSKSMLTLRNWRMQQVPNATDPKQLAEVRSRYADKDWTLVPPDANQMDAHSTAVFRCDFDLPAEALGKEKLQLVMHRVDDEGWVFVNGKFVGHTDSWKKTYEFDVTRRVKKGSNVVAVVVKNNGGQGGLGEVSFTHGTQAGANTPLKFGSPQGLDEKWWASDVDESGWQAYTVGSDSGEGDSLLTWHRVTFELPDKQNSVWTPWCVQLHAGGNGYMYLNGKALGRYWQNGGQEYFYLPECWLNFGSGKQNVLTLCLRPIDRSTGVQLAKVMPYSVYMEKV